MNSDPETCPLDHLRLVWIVSARQVGLVVEEDHETVRVWLVSGFQVRLPRESVREIHEVRP